MVLGKIPVPGRSTYFENSRARAYCAYSRCGWGLFGHFFLSSNSSLFFLVLSGRLSALLILKIVGQGPTVLTVGAGGGCLEIFLSSNSSLFSLTLSGRLGAVFSLKIVRAWSGGAKVLGKFPLPGRPTIWITVGQGPTALAVGAGGDCLDIFTLSYPFSPHSPSLWETARYRLKYCLKGPLNPKQQTNQ